jgi:hypothetical protein
LIEAGQHLACFCREARIAKNSAFFAEKHKVREGKVDERGEHEVPDHGCPRRRLTSISSEAADRAGAGGSQVKPSQQEPIVCL